MEQDDPNESKHSEQLDCLLKAATTNYDGHIARRVFVGPMPEKAILHMEREIKRMNITTGAITLQQLEDPGPHDVEDVARMLRKQARRLVKKRHRFRRRDSGETRSSMNDRSEGEETDEEDWGEEEQNTVDELAQKWRESEWGQAWSRRHAHKHDSRQHASHWVGGSFEIGCLLDVNVLHPNHPPAKPPAGGQERVPEITLTRPEELTAVQGHSSSSPSVSIRNQDETSITGSPTDSRAGLLPSLLHHPASDSGVAQLHKPSPLVAVTRQTFSETAINAKALGKQRQVHYEDTSPVELAPSVRPPPSVPPIEVLERTESQMEPTTSHCAMVTPGTPTTPDFQWGEVVMRDRMLVRIAYSKSEDFGPKFDDTVHRTVRDLQFEGWAEYIVAWRKDIIEIYEDHGIPGREYLTGSKHLAFVAPLKSSRTNLSLYSFVDLTFAITCPPMSTLLNSKTRKMIFSRSKPGTNIFIFKHKSRSRSWDWIWKLWRYLGGQLPPSIYVHNPRLATKVAVDIPYQHEMENQDLFTLFTRQNIIALCMKSLRTVPDYFALVEREITEHGRRLELCWRRDASLDWVWLEADAFGKSRPWATIAGLALAQSSRPPSLEIRLTSHAQTHYHLRNGTEIDEPPSVEGYVERIKPNTQLKQPLYLSVHSGLLFTINVEKAYPPAPPGIPLTLQDLDSWVAGLRRAEVQRGINQIMHANGVCDLRNIVAVRRAFQQLSPPGHSQKDNYNSDDSSWFDVWSQTEECTLDDDEDEGGEAFLSAAHGDRSLIRIRRSFELLLNTGNVIRFETHSRKVAVEWVNRLRALTVFWKHRHKVDAKEEMELVQARRPRLTPQVKVCQESEDPPEAPVDMSAPFPAMENLHNWCIIEGCDAITKGGKLYMRKGLRGQYKLVQMFVVAGHLVPFRIKPGSSLHNSSKKKINLLDAYVYSGFLSAINLPIGQFHHNGPTAPRRYQDGLETDDREEDMLFIINYRPHTTMSDAAKTPTFAPATNKTVPPLSAKHKILVFRTRSRIERDAWCWALNTEIEKMVRTQREREEKLMSTGELIELNK
ncbi:hypothetical protein FA15DRAFT_678662 [Coprinopsis marcescibilis]|uniref:PH domain-containing protein n=1 Tax=Coprinopsis marcescibilis TaxID=230819 RepID=A0A5C3L5I5_COPMA|nr:hypothetical protein FA15DRAFT_678662 [Coprinopsis marcescibilis]